MAVKTKIIAIIALTVVLTAGITLALKRLTIFPDISIVVVVSVMICILLARLVMNPLNNLLSTISNTETDNLQAAIAARCNNEPGITGPSTSESTRKINGLYDKNITGGKDLSIIKAELDHKNKVEGLNFQLELKINELETANRAITSLSDDVKNKNIELEKAVDKLKKINEIGRMLSSIVETQELMRIIIQTTADLLNAEEVTLHLSSPHKPSLTIRHRKGFGIEKIDGSSFEMNPEFKDLFTEGRPVITSSRAPEGPQDPSPERQKIGVPLKMKGRIIGAMVLENNSSQTTFFEEELEFLTTLSNQATVAIENAWLYESVKTNYFATIQSLVNALEANDRFTKGHSERVKLLSVELGKYIGLDFKEIELLEHAAILHDIGKIGIDNFILQKQGKLTAKEYSLIKTHPLIGDDILGPIDTLEGVRKTIIQHHERYDGNGYPYGLRGDEISLKARILSVVDTFDAMMTDRPYRKALSFKAIKNELKSNAGTQFDPYVVGAFVDMLDLKDLKMLAHYAGYNADFSAD